LAARVGKTRASPICPFLYHLYERRELLKPEEERTWKIQEGMMKYGESGSSNKAGSGSGSEDETKDEEEEEEETQVLLNRPPKRSRQEEKRRKSCSTDHLSDHVRRRRLHREALFSHQRWRAFRLLQARTGSKRFARP
jgi:hypothetical protein